MGCHCLLWKCSTVAAQKRFVDWTSLVVQWLRLWAPSAGSLDSVSDQGTKTHVLQLKPGAAKQINKYFCKMLLADWLVIFPEFGLFHWAVPIGMVEGGRQRRSHDFGPVFGSAGVYSFPSAATTNFLRLGGLKQEKCFCFCFFFRIQTSKCDHGCPPTECSREELFLASPGLWLPDVLVTLPQSSQGHIPSDCDHIQSCLHLPEYQSLDYSSPQSN